MTEKTDKKEASNETADINGRNHVRKNEVIPSKSTIVPNVMHEDELIPRLKAMINSYDDPVPFSERDIADTELLRDHVATPAESMAYYDSFINSKEYRERVRRQKWANRSPTIAFILLIIAVVICVNFHTLVSKLNPGLQGGFRSRPLGCL